MIRDPLKKLRYCRIEEARDLNIGDARPVAEPELLQESGTRELCVLHCRRRIMVTRDDACGEPDIAHQLSLIHVSDGCAKQNITSPDQLASSIARQAAMMSGDRSRKAEVNHRSRTASVIEAIPSLVTSAIR